MARLDLLHMLVSQIVVWWKLNSVDWDHDDGNHGQKVAAISAAVV